MEKISNSSTVIKKQRNELKRHYTISVNKKGCGFEARATLKIIGGGKNPRISAYSAISKNEAVCKILDKMYIRLSEYKKMNVLKRELCLNIYDAIMISIQELRLTSDSNVMRSATTVFQVLTITDNTSSPPTTYTQVNFSQTYNQMIPPNNVLPTEPLSLEEQNKINYFEQNQIKPISSKPLEIVAEEWFEYKKSLTIKSEENPKPLSPKTVEGYNDPLKSIIIPYFKNNTNISIITEKELKECINSCNGYRTKEIVYVVLKMLFDFAREKNYSFYVPRIKKPQKPYTDQEETIIYIESDRQDLWLDCFEKENTNVTLLFETMLLTGVRPEEACGLKWCAIDEKSNELIINNAYKDYPIYNGLEIIGHERGDGRLKTPESYRRIPLNPRLKRRLLEHKEKQKQLYKLYKMKWNENCYMFLNQYRQPFVAENLSKAMRTFIGKYDLEYMTPYGLRHSFATFCSEEGMDEIVLMRLMGHANFDTTQKYYIVISSKRKKQAIKEVYKNIFEKEYRREKAA